jgi:hypothetical protein
MFLLATVSVAFDASGARAQVISGPFQVNAYTSHHQNRPSIVPDGTGGFLVVWQSVFPAESSPDYRYWIRGRRIASDGHAAEPEFTVNSDVDHRHFAPALAVGASGTFVVAWEDHEYLGPTDIAARVFDGSGMPIGTQFTLNQFTTGNQVAPVIADRADGSFVVVWSSQAQDGAGSGIVARMLDASGSPAGTEFVVNSQTSGDQESPAVAARVGGGFVVVWDDGDADESYARLFDSLGTPLGTEFAIGAAALPGQRFPAVVTGDGSGGFLVVWSGWTDGSDVGIPARHFSAAGSPMGAAFLVNTYTQGDQLDPFVVSDEDGIIVAWHNGPGAGNTIEARRYDGTVTPIGPQFRLSAFRRVSNRDPAVAPLAAGRLAAVWEASQVSDNHSADGSGHSVYGVSVCADGGGADADADGIADTCDPCTNAGAQNLTIKPRIKLEQISEGSPPYNDRLGVSGEFQLPVGVDFSAIDPLSKPVRLRIAFADGRGTVDQVLAPTFFAGSGSAGWRLNGSATRWSFRDRTASPGAGIVSGRVDDRSQQAPGRVRVKFKGKNGFYPTPFDVLPLLRATIVVGDGESGECTDTAFAASDCVYTEFDNILTCVP